MIWNSEKDGPADTINLNIRHKENMKQLTGFFDKIEL